MKTASGVAGKAAVTATSLRTRRKSDSSQKQRDCGEAPHTDILLPVQHFRTIRAEDEINVPILCLMGSI
jgi:hypothetical protein